MAVSRGSICLALVTNSATFRVNNSFFPPVDYFALFSNPPKSDSEFHEK